MWTGLKLRGKDKLASRPTAAGAAAISKATLVRGSYLHSCCKLLQGAALSLESRSFLAATGLASARALVRAGEEDNAQVRVAAVGSAVYCCAPAFARRTPADPNRPRPRRPSRPRSNRSAGRGEQQPATPGDIVITAQGRTPGPVRTFRSRSPRSAAAKLQNSGATDIRQLNQLAPSLLVSSTGTEANGSRPHPRHRHGRRQSGPRKLGRGVHRRRLSLALRHRPQRTWRDRPGRGAARSAGHLVRPQRLGRPDQHHHQASRASTPEVYGEATSAITTSAGLRAASPAGSATRRRPARRRLCQARRLLQGRRSNDTDDQQPQPLFHCAASCCSSRASDLSVRLIGDYTRRNEACCGAIYRRQRVNSNIGNLNESRSTAQPVADRAHERHRQQHRQRPARPRPGPQRVHDGYDRTSRSPRAAAIRGKTKDWGVSGQVDYDLRRRELTSITAYRQYKSRQGGDFDYSTVDILYRDRRRRLARSRPSRQELRLQGNAFDDKLDWLVGGYYAEREPDARPTICGSAANMAGSRPAASSRRAALARRLCYSPGSPACLCRARQRAFGAASPARPLPLIDQSSTGVNDTAASTARHLQTEQQELGAVHAQHLPRSRRSSMLTVGAALHAREARSSTRRSATTTRSARPTRRLLGGVRRSQPCGLFGVRLARASSGRLSLSCQGNSTAELERRVDRRQAQRGQVHRHRRAVATSRTTIC